MTLAAVMVIGLAGGFFSALFGVGGGILFVPALSLGFGMSQLQAEASSLFAILPTALVGTSRLHRHRQVDGRMSAIVGGASIVGVQAGVLLAERLPADELRRLFGALLLIVAISLARKTLKRPEDRTRDEGADAEPGATTEVTK